MNYRDLVNDFLIESSMDDQIATVEGQQDDALKATRWVRDAWVQIQRAERWSFMWEELVIDTFGGKASYSLAEQKRSRATVGRDLGSKVDITSLRIPASKKYLRHVDLNAIRFSETTGEPVRVARSPDESIRFSPVPDAAYTITCDSWCAPVFLTDDLDTPALAPQWHKAIVWMALANYAREQGKEWQGLYTSATREFNHVYADMLRFYLPEMKPTEPLVR